LALATLLAGVTGNHPKTTAIATFNISSLGLSAYHDPTSPLHSNVTSLVPSDLANPPSITRYLGAHDWYRMSYLSNCSGFFLPSPSNPSLLTSTKINISCTSQPSGYRLRPHDVIEYELLPGVKALAEDVSTKVWDTSSWISLWYTGISNCFVTAVMLPCGFLGTKGRREWVPWWSGWNAFISAVLFLAESACITHSVLSIHRSSGLPGPNPWPGAFMGLTWSATCLMWTVCGLMWWQWRVERRNGGCGRCEGGGRVDGSRRAESAAPVGEWRSEKTLVVGEKA